MALHVEPEDNIQFQGPLNEVVTTEITLTNRSEDQLAFKVKTTAPRRYAVRPNSGSLNPGENIMVSVMRQPFEVEPNERARHKFMIQSVKVLPGQNVATIWADADPSTFKETKLRVLFDEAQLTVRSSITEEEYQRMLSDNRRLSKVIETLQTERVELRSQIMKASDGTNSPQVPKGLSLIFYEKNNILFIIVLLAAFFFGGLLMAETILSATPAEH